MPVLIALLLAAPADPGSAAREHLKAGQTHYALGEFQAAVDEFREVYRLKQEPGLLFNMGQAYRQLHEWQQALFNYRQYLNLKPDAPNRAEVEALIEHMQKQIQSDQKARAARTAAAPPAAILPAPRPEPAAAAPPPPQARPAAALRVAGFAALGLGALAEGGALLLHASAQSAADDFNARYAAGQLSAADAALASTARSRGGLATAAVIGGAVLIAAGAALCVTF